MLPLNHPSLLNCTFQLHSLLHSLPFTGGANLELGYCEKEPTSCMCFAFMSRFLGRENPFLPGILNPLQFYLEWDSQTPCGWHGCECAWWVIAEPLSRCTTTSLGEKWNQHWNLLEVRKFAFNTNSIINCVEAGASKILLFLTFLFKSSVESLGSPSSFFSLVCYYYLDTPYEVKKKKSYNF